MKKVLLITQNEPFFIPKMVKYLISQQKDNYSISGITILNPHRKNKNYLHWFKERAQVYTITELFIVAMAFAYTKFQNKVKTTSDYSINSVVKKNQIQEINTNDVNSIAYIEKIRELNIDIIISISCPQLFKEELLSAVNYCINAHGTLLPRHRGVFGSWWMLFSGDKVGGSTIHTMELKLDAGEILWQKEFQIETKDTQYSIAYKTKRDMSYGLVEVLKNILINKVIPICSKYESSYHRAPKKEQGKAFRKIGHHIIKLKDIKLILSKSF